MSELAWAAGFYDGEGCTYMNKQRPSMTIAQGTKEPLERFVRAVGFGRIYGPYKYSTNRQPHWVLYINGEKPVVETFEKLKPWLCSIKRRQAEDVIARRAAFVPKKPGPKKGTKRAN
jgi:hypothetical protein